MFPEEQIGTTCCYATQDKAWVTGPAGERWEVYTVVSDSETFGTSPDLLASDPSGECSCATCDTTETAGGEVRTGASRC
jgi:lactoylglutathione lyase